MSNIRKRMIAIAVVACMALTAIVGCDNSSVGKGGSVSSNKSSSSESSSSTEEAADAEQETVGSDMLITPFQTGNADELGITDPNAPTDANNDTTTAKDNKTTTAAAIIRAAQTVCTVSGSIFPKMRTMCSMISSSRSHSRSRKASRTRIMQ